MSQKFQAAVQHRNDVSYVKLGGVIDEDNELPVLLDQIPAGTAVIDLGEIERINSCGVRDWVNWLNKLENNGTRSVLVECSPAIVAQINLVNNFTGSGVVKSFYVPYFCAECNEEKVLLVEAGDMGPPPHEPPTCRCDECDLVMDFDDMPDSYFAFLSNQRKLAEPDKISGAMRELGRQSQAAAKARTRASQPNLAPATSMPSLQVQRSAPRQSAGYPTSGMAMVPPSGAAQMVPMSGPIPMHPGMGASGGVPAPLGHAPSNPSSIPGGHMSSSAMTSRPQQRSTFSTPGTMPPGGPGGPRITGTISSAHLQTGQQAMQQTNGFQYAVQKTQPVAAPTRSNALVFVLITILLAAIGVLAYLVLTK